MKPTIYDNVYDVIFHPYTAMERIARECQIGQAVIVALFGMLIPMGAVALGPKTGYGASFVNVLAVLELVGSLLLWVLGASLWSFLAEVFGGQGRVLGLFTALGFAHLSRIFLVPLWVLAALMPEGLKTLLMGGSGLAVLLWSLLLNLAAIRGSHGLSMARAALVMLTPAVCFLFVILLLLMVVGIEFLQRPLWL